MLATPAKKISVKCRHGHLALSRGEWSQRLARTVPTQLPRKISYLILCIDTIFPLYLKYRI